MEVIVTRWYVSWSDIWCCSSLSKVVVLSRITTTNCSTVLLWVPTADLTLFQWIIKVIFLAGLTILNNERCLSRLSGCRGWSRGCTPPLECCRLPPTYFWTTWHQTRAFLISVNNKKWFFWLVWQFWKRWDVWALWVDVGVIPWLHST